LYYICGVESNEAFDLVLSKALVFKLKVMKAFKINEDVVLLVVLALMLGLMIYLIISWSLAMFVFIFFVPAVCVLFGKSIFKSKSDDNYN